MWTGATVRTVRSGTAAEHRNPPDSAKRRLSAQHAQLAAFDTILDTHDCVYDPYPSHPDDLVARCPTFAATTEWYRDLRCPVAPVGTTSHAARAMHACVVGGRASGGVRRSAVVGSVGGDHFQPGPGNAACAVFIDDHRCAERMDATTAVDRVRGGRARARRRSASGCGGEPGHACLAVRIARRR